VGNACGVVAAGGGVGAVVWQAASSAAVLARKLRRLRGCKKVINGRVMWCSCCVDVSRSRRNDAEPTASEVSPEVAGW
jgi:hypothetical protein